MIFPPDKVNKPSGSLSKELPLEIVEGAFSSRLFSKWFNTSSTSARETLFSLYSLTVSTTLLKLLSEIDPLSPPL